MKFKLCGYPLPSMLYRTTFLFRGNIYEMQWSPRSTGIMVKLGSELSEDTKVIELVPVRIPGSKIIHWTEDTDSLCVKPLRPIFLDAIGQVIISHVS